MTITSKQIDAYAREGYFVKDHTLSQAAGEILLVSTRALSA